jgi:hypothetical protein
MSITVSGLEVNGADCNDECRDELNDTFFLALDIPVGENSCFWWWQDYQGPVSENEERKYYAVTIYRTVGAGGTTYSIWVQLHVTDHACGDSGGLELQFTADSAYDCMNLSKTLTSDDIWQDDFYPCRTGAIQVTVATA